MSCRGHSLPLQRRLTDFGAEKSFAKAAKQALEHYGIEVSENAVRNITEAHGEALQGCIEFQQGEANSKPREQLIAETDGTMIPIVTTDPAQETDQRKTRKVKWKEARLGLIYEQGTTEPIFGVTTGSPEEAGEQLANCASRVGLGDNTKIHGVGDGATWIADQIEILFGSQGSYLIDFYHLCDYLSAASKSCAADSGKWFALQKQRFLDGMWKDVLEALKPHIEPTCVEDKNAPVRACDRYIRNRPGQFDYSGANDAGLPIGSGQIESAHRYVIQERIKIPGAWWKLNNADKMLALRITRVNGHWEKYWSSLKAPHNGMLGII